MIIYGENDYKTNNLINHYCMAIIACIMPSSIPTVNAILSAYMTQIMETTNLSA